MADELKARLSVDTSEFSQKIAQAMAQAKVATTNAAKAFEKYGLDAAAGVQVAVEALAKDVAALDAAKASVAALRAEQDKLNASTSHTVSTMAAASGEIRLFEGNIPIRAVENFAAKTLGLGPIMQAAFPVAGAIAAGSIIFDVGEKLEALREKGLHAGEAITEAFAGLHDKAQITNDDLRIQDDKLKDEIAKLSGHPGDGLQTALDEAIKRADSLLISLKADGKEMEALFKANGVGFGASVLSGVASTNQQEKELLADNKNLIGAVRTANEQYAAELANSKTPEEQKAAGDRQAAAIRAAYQKQLDAYTTEAARLKKEQADSQSMHDIALQDGGRGGGGKVVDNSAKLANIQGVADSLRDRITALQISQSLAADQQTVNKLKGDGKEKGGGNPDADRLRSDEEGRDAEKQQGATDESKRGLLSANADREYWEQRIAAYKTGGEQYKAIVQKITQDDIEIEKQAAALKREVMGKAIELQNLKPPDDIAKGAEKMDEWRKKTNADFVQVGEAWNRYRDEQAKAEEIAAQTAQAQALARIEMQQQTGVITKSAADMQIAAAHTADYTAKLMALEKELKRLQGKAKTDPATGQNTDPKNAAQQQQVQDQIAQLQAQQIAAASKDRATITNDIAKPYIDAFQEVGSSFMRMQSQMLTGHKSFSQAMRQEEQSLAMFAIQSIEKKVMAQIEADIRKRISHQAMKAAENTTDATAAAASNAIATEQHAQQGALSASTAAKNAYAAMTGVPVVGPVLAPIAAAAAFVAVAAFETGGIIPNTGIAMVHQGEAVLPRQLTDHLMDSAKGGSSTTSGHTFNNTLHYHANGGSDSKVQARQAMKMMQKQVLRAHAVMS